MARTRRRAAKAEKPGTIRGLAFSEETYQTLQVLAEDLGRMTGRSVSASGALRALLRWVGRQPRRWGQETLLSFTEEEASGGVVWGRQKRGS
jgi:hypothetical protein